MEGTRGASLWSCQSSLGRCKRKRRERGTTLDGRARAWKPALLFDPPRLPHADARLRHERTHPPGHGTARHGSGPLAAGRSRESSPDHPGASPYFATPLPYTPIHDADAHPRHIGARKHCADREEEARRGGDRRPQTRGAPVGGGASGGVGFYL